jgi:phenylpropionate dioxygenase-like ring-hydroxylating dioxygenase large terminal subunit
MQLQQEREARAAASAQARAAKAPPGAELHQSLPAWTYESAEFFELEREHIFLPSWQVVCHVSDLPEPGDYATLDLLSERAVVVRGKDDRLRGFHNVCRHRAHAVVEGERGRCPNALRCPYHGWTYGFDGRLSGVPDRESFRALDRNDYGLQPLDLEVFAGFVFIRFRSEGPSVRDRLAAYEPEISRYRIDEMAPLYRDVWSEAHEIDWKNVMDNYLEDYHFPIGHPGLAALMERDYDREVDVPGASRLSHEMKSRPQKAWSVRHYQKLLPDREHLPVEQRRRWTYISLFPGVSLELFPEQAQFFQVLPVAPGRCLLRGRSYALPGESRQLRAARYLADRINAQVQREDNRLTASVQRGLRSSSYSVGLLSDKEVVTRAFQDWVRERIPLSRLATAPEAGSARRRNSELAGAAATRCAPGADPASH